LVESPERIKSLTPTGDGARVLLGAVRRGQQRRSDTGDGVGPAAR
jgi:hypothetical protein